MNTVPPEPGPEPDRRDPLRIWTIYDHPSDSPDAFVLRPHDVLPGGIVEYKEGYACADIEVLREHMRAMGLTCIPRAPGDDPIIVESWL